MSRYDRGSGDAPRDELHRLAAEGARNIERAARAQATNANREAERNLRIALGAHYGTLIPRLHIAVGVGGGGILLARAAGLLGADWMLWGILSASLGLIGSQLITPVASRGRVSQESEWLASKPFPISGYLEALGATPQPATQVYAHVSFTDTVPPLEIVQGLLGRVDPHGAATPQGRDMVLRSAPISGSTGIRQNKVPVRRNHRIIPYVHGLVDQVLAPLHARYPIDHVELSRAP